MLYSLKSPQQLEREEVLVAFLQVRKPGLPGKSTCDPTAGSRGLYQAASGAALPFPRLGVRT